MKTLWILLGVGAVGGAIWYFNKKGLPPLTTDPQPQSLAPASAISTSTPPLVATTPEQQEAAQVMQNIQDMVVLATGKTEPANLAPPPAVVVLQKAVAQLPESKIKSIIASKLMNS